MPTASIPARTGPTTDQSALLYSPDQILGRLYSGDMGSLTPSAPPTFRASDWWMSNIPDAAPTTNNPTPTSTPTWISNFGGRNSDNWQTRTGPNGELQFAIKDAAHGGAQWTYQQVTGPDGQQYMVPVQGSQQNTFMAGGTPYGPDVWVPLTYMAGAAGGILSSGSGAAAGAAGGASGGGSAAEVIPISLPSGSAPTALAPLEGYGGAAVGAGGAAAGAGGGGGSAVGAGTGGGGGTGTGTGLFGTDITPGQAVQLGGAVGGLLGGGNNRGSPVQTTSPIYGDPGQIGQLNRPYQPSPQLTPPRPISMNQSAQDIWQQYTQNLYRPTSQPPSVPGVFGMQAGGYGGFLSPQVRPVGSAPGMLSAPAQQFAPIDWTGRGGGY